MDNKILLDKELIPDYRQIDFIDKEKRKTFPEWVTGKEIVVFGERGVAIATKTKKIIRLLVIEGKDNSHEYILSVSGLIDIGKKGVEVGNFISGEVFPIKIPKGTYSINIVLDYDANTFIIYLMKN